MPPTNAMKQNQLVRILLGITIIVQCGDLPLRAQEAPIADPSHRDDLPKALSFTGHPASYDPRVALNAFNHAKELFLSQVTLLSLEHQYEDALSRGERPEKPLSYTSTSSRKEAVKDSFYHVRANAHYLTQVLGAPKNAAMDSDLKHKLEEAIAYLPVAEQILKEIK